MIPLSLSMMSTAWALISALAIVVLGIASLMGGRSRARGAIAFGLFAVCWGIQIAAANLASVASSEAAASLLYGVSFVLLLVTPPVLLLFVSSQVTSWKMVWRGLSLAAGANAVIALFLTLAGTGLVYQGVAGEAGAFSPVYSSLWPLLVTIPFYGTLTCALIGLVTSRNESITPRTMTPATTLAVGLAIVVAFSSAHNAVIFANYALTDPLEGDVLLAIVLGALTLICGAVGYQALRAARTSVTSQEKRLGHILAAAIFIPLVWGLMEGYVAAQYAPTFSTIGLWRLAGVAVIAYGLARWRVFDLPQRTQSAAATAAGATGAAAGGALAYSAAALAFPGLLVPAIAGLAVAGAALVPGVRVAKRIVYTMKGQSQEKLEETLYGQRIETYRAALEASLARGSLEADEPFLSALRERFGITEPEDRVLRHYAKNSVLVPREGDGASTYERLRLLGEGGGGRTWLARDRVRDRLVVIKEPLGRWQHEPALKESVLREARLASKVRHPNVVAIEEVAEHNGCPVIVMEYLEGGSVEDALRSRGNLPWRESVSLVEGVLRGLEAVHAVGIVHRDVKPSNVLLSGDRVPKLADFGVAIPSSTGGKTVVEAGATTLAGTMAYMSPEQRAGTSIGDRQSDLYACAALLHECLYGTPPVPGAVIRFQNDLPAGLQAVLTRGLAANPAERYASARAFAEDLRRAAAAPGVKA